MNSSGALGVDLRCYQGGILTVCPTGDQTKTLDPGLRRDDVCCCGDDRITGVIPANAGIQCLSLNA